MTNWLTGWDRRKKITLTGGSDGAQTYYQLKLVVTYDSDMQSDFDDLRFTKSDGVTLIDAWLESKTDSTTANIWVEFPTTPASAATEDYYMYYGNSSVSNVWNGGDTFIFFDDAETGAFGDKWTNVVGSGGSYSTTSPYKGSKCILASGDKSIIGATGISQSDCVCEAMFKCASQNDSMFMGRSSLTSEDSYYYYTDSTNSILYKKISGGWTNLDEDTSSDDLSSWKLLSIYFDGTSIKTYFDNSIRNSTTDSSISSGSIGARSSANIDVYLDDVRVRKFTTNAATYGIGSEEKVGIKYGSEYTFDNNSISHIAVEKIDSTHFIVGYREVYVPLDDEGHCEIGTVSGSTISYGNYALFNNSASTYISISLLDSTHFVIAYCDGGNSNYGTARIGTISGTTITYGSEYVFNSASTSYISVDALDSTHFVVGYRDSDNKGKSIIGTVSGTTISYGSEYVFNSNNPTDYISVEKIDSTHFLIGSTEYGFGIGRVKIGTVSGSTISYSTGTAFNAISTAYISISLLDSTHFVIAYCDGDNSSYGTTRIGTISGTTITFGSVYAFNSASTSYVSVNVLDSTHFVVGYRDSDNKGRSIIGTVSGTTISYGSEYVFKNASANYISVAALDVIKFVIGYNDGDGKCVIGSNLRTFIESISNNVLIKKLGIGKTSTNNTLIKKLGITETITNNILVKKLGIVKTITNNILVKKLLSLSTTVNTIFVKVFSLSTTIDCILSAIKFAAVSSNTLLKKFGISDNIVIDTLIKKLFNVNLSINSIIKKIGLNNITSNILIKKVISKGITSNTLVKKVISKYITSNILLKNVIDKYITSNTLIKKVIDKTLTSNTVIRKTINKYVTLNTLIKGIFDNIITSNTLIKKLIDKVVTSNTLIKLSTLLSNTCNTLILKYGNIKELTINSIVAKKGDKSISSDLLIVLSGYIRGASTYTKKKSSMSFSRLKSIFSYK